MTLLDLVVVVLVIALVLWLINNALQLDAGTKKVLNMIIAVIAVLFLINLLFPGIFGSHVPTLR